MSQPALRQPTLSSRQAPGLHLDDLVFKDLNKNGVLDPYEDWRLPIEERVADLAARMTVEEQVGLMIYGSNHGAFIGPEGEVLDVPRSARPPMPWEPRFAGQLPNPEPIPPRKMVVDCHIRYVNNFAFGLTPRTEVRWNNALQELAEGTRLGIPMVFGTDPRTANPRSGLSQWPPQLGLAALRDPEAVYEYAHLTNEEYRALGIRFHIAPMADVATEPRWPRIPGTFGEDAYLAAELIQAYVEGMQGRGGLGREGVIVSVKHFPGDGPVHHGLDPHNAYGKLAVYPGGQFGYHLIPFRAAFAAGAGAVMTCYAIPVGHDDVGAGFSYKHITELLREQMGFDGLVVTDWGITRNMPWGVEDQPLEERQRRIIASGHDQIGGESEPSVLLGLVRDGALSSERIAQSARRILRPMFQMGLFEDPYVDEALMPQTVARVDIVAAGARAQRRSTVMLKNEGALLPIGVGRKVYVRGIATEVAAPYATLVDDPREAEVAIVSVQAPYQIMPGQTFFGGAGPAAGEGGRARGGRHEGSLAYAGAENAAELEAILTTAAACAQTVVVIHLDRPAVLSEFIDRVAGVLGHFGSDDAAILDVLFGRAKPEGRLPFNLPRDMESVLRQQSDVAHDLEDPLFRFGDGLRYAE